MIEGDDKRGVQMPGKWRAFAFLMLLASLVSVSCSDDAVEVTGSTGDCFESNTEWIGDPPADVAVPGEILTRTITCPERTMSDSRLDGETVINIRCEFSNQDGQTIGDCVKDATTTNERGTWVEEGGTLQIIVGTPSEVVEQQSIQVGTGEYEGLQLVYTTGGTEYPWRITGTLETTE